MIEPVIKL